MSSVPAPSTNTPKRVSKMASNQNLNHLLNFTLPPRETRPLASIPRRSRRTGQAQGVWNKERFVNAQYRFVMNPTGDYTVHFADPDIFFQWQDILQVIIPRSSALASAAATGEHSSLNQGHTTCPICFSPPTAPRMTKCGHIFCFPCILHYLSISDNKWARCPICFDSVNERQLKIVKWYDAPVHTDEDAEGSPADASSSSSAIGHIDTILRTGSILRMRLMQRPQITTLALPRSYTWPSDLLPPHQAPFHFLPDVFSHAKFMLATPAYMISDLTKDLDDLAAERRILVGMHDDLEVSFVDAAELKIRQQIAKAAALETPVLKERIDKAIRDQREIEERCALYNLRNKTEDRFSTSTDVPEEFLALKPTGAYTPSPRTEKTLPTTPQLRNQPRQRKNLNPPPPSTSTYYYYQAASGLPLFLHPLDIKILLAHYNGYPSFPDSISVRVESFSEGSVNDDLRKRCKYLAHMPEGADVVFIEADLEGVVGAEGLKNFEGPLRMRTLRRKEKSRKDDRARARAEERDKDRMMSHTNLVPSARVMPARPSPVEIEEPSPEQPQPLVAGAWGVRSFASALHSPPSQGGGRSVSAPQRVARQDVQDAEDIDIAWHELEQRQGQGRKKRGTRLVVLGGGGGGGARRR